MKTVQVERAQLEQWLQAFKKIHDDKHSHWDVDEEISAIEKALEPIAMEVMKSDEADFWRWWKPYQLKDCWRLELVARDAWMAAKINTDADIAYLITKVKEAIQYPSRWDTAAYPTLQSALHELTARYKVSGCETLKTEQHASDAITWTPDTGYVFAQPKEPEQRSVSEHLEPVGYQQLFDAISAAANTPYEGAVGISVSAFEKALGSRIYTTPPQCKPLTDEQMQFLATAIGQAQQIIDTHNAEFVTARDDLRRCAELLAAHGIKE